ncbi:hypothetical protein CGLO_17985 [Colletotrichum gloeosporioides Cg-14]|uniref:EF-hand domain-containing protein n=1 Tax=Colletotrichum gloeosporioides (strain Cg-14) TaxID=1237896 RepID=T0KVK6_COLGC|nr:hypothetical protein CGLO_17985 [Colletotrichum gloeosporioides Cg-14]
MGVTEWVAELEMDMEESQNQRDKRVEELWKQLDVQGTGYLDFKGLQKGLNRIDHPMRNAEDMLRRIMTVVDTNADGKIQYEGELRMGSFELRLELVGWVPLSWGSRRGANGC